MSVVQRFYSAFAQRDWSTMGACYADEARFSDPVFPDLDASGARAMWKMLLTSGSDLRITFTVQEETAERAYCVWEAHYTFGRTGRHVHNTVRTRMLLRDGLIVRQWDHFDLWAWSRQALGAKGLLLGWSPIVRNKVRAMAAARLRAAIGPDAR